MRLFYYYSTISQELQGVTLICCSFTLLQQLTDKEHRRSRGRSGGAFNYLGAMPFGKKSSYSAKAYVESRV